MFEQIFTASLTVVTGGLASWLTHVFYTKQRSREDEFRRAQEQREEQRRRDAHQHDWLTEEHRRLVYKVGNTAFDVRNAATVLLHGFGDAAAATGAATASTTALAEFQDTFRRAKILASAEFDAVVIAAHACLVKALVHGQMAAGRDAIEGAPERLEGLNALKQFDDSHWPALVVAVRRELRDGPKLDPEANPLI